MKHNAHLSLLALLAVACAAPAADESVPVPGPAESGAVVAPAEPAGPAFPAATPESQGLSADALAGLVAAARDYVDRDMIVGAELLVIQNRRTVLHECFGYADRDDEVPWTVGTVCNIRSMTKTLTGAAAQILVDRGELSLDDPVAKYLPGFDTDEARAITVREIITHRAGLPLTILVTMNDHEDLVEMGNAVGARGPEYEPGSRFWYSDAGTEALGAIVEVVSGRTLDAFVHDEFLVPLGMTESFYFLDDEDPRREKIASLYIGGVGNWERFWNPDEKSFYPYAWGSQSLYSTPMDYAKFLAMWMDGGRVGDRAVLSEEAVARTLTPVSEMTMLGSDARFPTSFRDLEVYYGQMSVLHVPIEADGEGPATIIGHSGSDGTIAWCWPERDLMVLFYTQSRGGGTVLRFEDDVDRLLINPGARAGDEEVDPELVPYLGTYIGDYAQHTMEEFEVRVAGGKFLLDIPSQMAFELLPADEPGKWTFAISDMITLWFERDEEGRVDRLRIRQGGLEFEAPRAGSARLDEYLAETAVDPAEVDKYLGVYYDEEEDANVEVLIDGRHLAISTPEIVFHLWKVPGQDAWLVKESGVMIVTFQEEGGVVHSFTRSVQNQSRVFPRVE